MSSPQQLHELHQLMSALCDGHASAEDQAQLQDWVLNSDAACAFYVEYMHLHAAVARHNLSAESPVVVQPACSPERSRLPVLSFLGELAVRGRSSYVLLTLLIATLVYGSFGLLVWQMSRYSFSASRQSPLAEERPRNSRDVLRAPVARLVSTAGCRWVGSASGRDGKVLHPGELQLAEGLAELEFMDGACVTLEAPLRFELVSSNSGFLHSGKLVARVPRQAGGFTVATPTATVVDLGTEFAMQVGPKGATEVQVLEGKVILKPGKKDDPNKAVLELILSAGMARKVELGSAGQPVSVRETVWRPESFVRRVTSSSSRSFITGESRASSKNLQHRAKDLVAVAYQLEENSAGNQRDFHGGVGLDFEVREPIRVFSLGVFDHLGDGIDPATSPTVQLWSRHTQATAWETSDDTGIAMLASMVFTAGDDGELMQGHRFKPLAKPIDLPVGSYSIVTYGLSDANPFITFENAVADVDLGSEPGWTGSNNHSGGNHYGWSPSTNKAGGQVGEAGGTFARVNGVSFYGDTHLSSTYSLDRKISASGKFNINNISQEWASSIGRSGFFVGHFSRDSGNPMFLGLEFENAGDAMNDALSTTIVRVRARVRLSRYTIFASSDLTLVSAKGNHAFRYIYDPDLGENGRLTVNIDDQPALVADLTDGERNLGAQFTAFGIGAMKDMNSDSDPAKTAQLLVDDMSYSGCRLATSARVAVDAGKLQMETSRGLIMPMGSRWGEGKPGTFPRMADNRPGGVVAGSFEYGQEQRAEGRGQ